jgi:hypothetical protein
MTQRRCRIQTPDEMGNHSGQKRYNLSLKLGKIYQNMITINDGDVRVLKLALVRPNPASKPEEAIAKGGSGPQWLHFEPS